MTGGVSLSSPGARCALPDRRLANAGLGRSVPSFRRAGVSVSDRTLSCRPSDEAGQRVQPIYLRSVSRLTRAWRASARIACASERDPRAQVCA